MPELRRFGKGDDTVCENADFETTSVIPSDPSVPSGCGTITRHFRDDGRWV
jgi:hypothetical protein